MTTITLHGFEWRESYGSLTLTLPLASIETHREAGRQSDTAAGHTCDDVMQSIAVAALKAGL